MGDPSFDASGCFAVDSLINGELPGVVGVVPCGEEGEKGSLGGGVFNGSIMVGNVVGTLLGSAIFYLSSTLVIK